MMEIIVSNELIIQNKKNTKMDHLKYPIGTFVAPEIITADHRVKWIADIAALPQQLREATSGLSDNQLDTPYRDGGWTLRQVVHHVADSHINAYTRYKLAATEDNPTIRPYEEAIWAELPEAKQEAVEVSLALLDALHHRWVLHLRNMKEEDFSRTFFHPESKKTFRLDFNLGLYSWHGRHHLAHITTTKERLNW
jgi:DinB superfamily